MVLECLGDINCSCTLRRGFVYITNSTEVLFVLLVPTLKMGFHSLAGTSRNSEFSVSHFRKYILSSCPHTINYNWINAQTTFKIRVPVCKVAFRKTLTRFPFPQEYFLSSILSYIIWQNEVQLVGK
jgi:hypothetical protein